ncbi:MAG: hypothetical protein KY428_07000 [Bacteroidetes bacterium]|nr:hypothetical protein [Bacteroidota bacterium]
MEKFIKAHEVKESPFIKQKPVIIEFVGPPGAGKTTNCQYFLKLLKERDLNVITRQEIEAYVRKMGAVEKSYLYATTVLFRGHLIVYYAFFLVFLRIYSLDSIYRYTRLSVYKLALEELIKNSKTDIVLLDQWMIQELWSATIFKDAAYDTIAQQLSKFYFKADLVFYFTIDVETASERIAHRGTTLSRFDSMTPKQRLRELLKYGAYLFQLFEQSDCTHKYKFCGKNSPSANALIFFQYLIFFDSGSDHKSGITLKSVEKTDFLAR